ncbi:N-acetylneuraminate synthase family protein [Candidatus Pelagibacter communis]|uniref:N-acetylneuraminate synthase family protein n=1 Tax=Candidatus Pelagibacter TaxID=198251 RepID=UPI003EDF1C51
MNSNKTFIIAEIGVNHNNDINISKKIINFCSKQKIDAVKFQTFKAEKLALKATPKVNYQKKNKLDKESHYQMLKKLELSEEDHFELKKYCEKKNVEFISTPYDVESAKFLVDINVKTIKVASADLTDFFLHEYLAKTKKKIIISTGMSNIKDISNTLKLYKKKNSNHISLLHCVSNYPCSDHSLNLNCLEKLEKFGCRIGFSDHSKEHLSSSLAIAKGAKIIEKHITLNNQLIGPDHKASLNLNDFENFVTQIRKTERMLGSKEKKIQQEEKEMLKISKKGLYYNDNFQAGKKIKRNDLISLRPFTGLKVSDYRKIVNKTLKNKVKKQQKVKMKHFCN